MRHSQSKTVKPMTITLKDGQSGTELIQVHRGEENDSPFWSLLFDQYIASERPLEPRSFARAKMLCMMLDVLVYDRLKKWPSGKNMVIKVPWSIIRMIGLEEEPVPRFVIARLTRARDGVIELCCDGTSDDISTYMDQEYESRQLAEQRGGRSLGMDIDSQLEVLEPDTLDSLRGKLAHEGPTAFDEVLAEVRAADQEATNIRLDELHARKDTEAAPIG